MNKKTKIKRHYSIYKTTSPWKRGLKISLFVLGLLVLGFVGYSVYAPVMDFISGESESSVSSVSLSSEEVSQSSSSSSSETSVSSSYESSGIAVSTALEQCFAAPLTQDIAKEPASLSSYLSLLSQKGYTAVVFEAKDQEGILHYQSASGTARSSGAIADDAVDLAAVARECRVKGISLYTLMYAFEDHYAGLADPSMAIKYSGDEGVYWLDDYAMSYRLVTSIRRKNMAEPVFFLCSDLYQSINGRNVGCRCFCRDIGWILFSYSGWKRNGILWCGYA